MTTPLSQEVIALLNDDSTIKVLATVDAAGTPHAVVKDSLHVADGEIRLLELLESSTTGRNLVRSIWFDQPLAIALRGRDGQRIQIKGKAVRNHIAGPLYQQHYRELRAQQGDVELAGVWVIEPHSITDQRLNVRRAEEDAAHPNFIHLDRILKQGATHETL